MNAMTKHFSPATVADVKVAGPDMLVPNEEAQKVQEAEAAAKKAAAALNAAYAGAYLLLFLVRHPWINTVQLDFKPTMDGDDAGGYNRNLNASLSEITAVPECDIPADFRDVRGDLDAELAEDRLCDSLQDEQFFGEIYSSIFEHWENDDIVIKLDRSKVQHILDSGDMSGLAAFRILLPDFLHKIGGHSPALAAAG